MALSIITDKFRIENAKKFVQSVKQRVYPSDFSTTTTDYEASKSAVLNSQADRLYMMIGKITTWYDPNNLPAGISDKDAVPAITDDIRSESELWSNAQIVKQVTSTHVRHVIPRQNWTTGVVYPFYQSNSSNTTTYSSSTTENFYVLDEAEYRVYKCLWNNYGSNSTVKPTQVGSAPDAKRIQREPFETTDGYIWKYMYTISASDVTAFVTDNFIPVEKDDTNTPNTTADGGIYKIYLTSTNKGTYSTYATGGSGTPAGTYTWTGSENFSRVGLSKTGSGIQVATLRDPDGGTLTGDGVSNNMVFDTRNSSGTVTIPSNEANDLVGQQIERIITATDTTTGGEKVEICEITASSVSTNTITVTGLKRLDSTTDVILTHAATSGYAAGETLTGSISGCTATVKSAVSTTITTAAVTNGKKFLDGENITDGSNVVAVSAVQYGFSKLASGKEERFYIAPLIEIEGEGENASGMIRLNGETGYDTSTGKHYPVGQAAVSAAALDVVMHTNGTGYRNIDVRNDTDGTLNSHVNIKFGKAKVGATSGDSTSTGTTVINSLARKIVNAARISSVTPYGGHSFDNVSELYGYTIMINQNFVGTESGVADAANDFRQIALVQNPLEQHATLGSETIADQTIYNSYVRLEFAGDVTSTVQVDDLITDQAAATDEVTLSGRVVSATYISGTDGSSNNVTRVLLAETVGFYNKSYADVYYLNDSRYLYLADDVSANSNPHTALTLSTFFGANGADSDSNKIYYRGLNSSASTVSRGLRHLSGDMMYMENRAPITRASDQTENVKLIIEY